MSLFKNNRRLHILSEAEVSMIYGHPQFTDMERTHFFALSKDILCDLKLYNVKKYKKISLALYFILQYGYFKAKHLFFSFQYSEIKEDVQFILKTYMPNNKIPIKLPSKKLQSKVKKKILMLEGFIDNIKETDKLIFDTAERMIKKTNKLILIFREVVNCLEKHRLILPAYSRLQKIIGTVLKNEQERIIKVVKNWLTKSIEYTLVSLFNDENLFYKITELKFDAKSFNKQAMQIEIDKILMCNMIYSFSKELLPHLQISRENIEYYANLAKLYTAYRLKYIPKEVAFLYLTCYVHERYEKIINNLAQGFIYYVDNYHSQAKKYALNNEIKIENPLEKNRKSIGKLLQLYADNKVMKLSGRTIRKKAYGIMKKEDILETSQILLNDPIKKEETELIWKFHKENYRAMLLNLRPLFNTIDFEVDEDNKDLLTAILFLKENFSQGVKVEKIKMKDIPIKHIRHKGVLNYFYETDAHCSKKGKEINFYQYEFYLYLSIRENIRKGKVFIDNSVEYKRFSKDLNLRVDWGHNQENILKELNNEVLLRPIDKTLFLLENELESLIERVNKRIQNGENQHIKIKRHRDGKVTWTLPYPKKNKEADNPFFDNTQPISISLVFDFMEKQCGFTRSFTHIKSHRSKENQDYLGIKATILANGTAQGIYQFSKWSNLDYLRLQQVEKNYLRLETLRDAANIIMENLVNLPIFSHYNIGGKRHGSKDGKKKKIKRKLLKARYSPKYFGLDSGLVIMTLILNHIPLATSIIGANEHESHYMLPLLLANATSVNFDLISTDTAGTNNVNDFFAYLLGVVHAACYRSIGKKAETISGFRPLAEYEDKLIKPHRMVKKKLIQKKWPEILPMLVAVLSGEFKLSILVKKLSSHDYKNNVKEALWELNNILKSIHILKYIDEPDYRRAIRKALNRGEAYHQLMDKIMEAGGGDFRGMSELEVEIWNECSRLIALLVIGYNMHILSRLYDLRKKEGDETGLEFLKHISSIASQHIHMGGFYEFIEEMSIIDIGPIVNVLNKFFDKKIKEPVVK